METNAIFHEVMKHQQFLFLKNLEFIGKRIVGFMSQVTSYCSISFDTSSVFSWLRSRAYPVAEGLYSHYVRFEISNRNQFFSEDNGFVVSLLV